MTCHGPQRQGGGNFPGLMTVQKRYTEDQFLQLLVTGRRMMPGFAQLSAGEKKALAAFILEQKDKQRQKFREPARPEDACAGRHDP